MNKTGLSFHHVALAVNNFDEVKNFYVNGLGMSVYAEWGSPEKTIALIDVGSGEYIELFSNGTGKTEENARYIHLALKTDNVDEMYEKALCAGAKQHIAPKSVHTESKPVDITLRCAFVIGKGGEQIEFFNIEKAE